MRAAPVVLLALLGLSAGSALRADVSAARSLVAHCAATAEPSLRGLDRLRDACPGIEQALDELGSAPFLPFDWRTHLSPRALGDFAGLAARYSDRVTWGGVRPDALRLRSIALALKPAPPPVSWWDRLRAWVRHWLERAGGEQASWLRFLPNLHVGPGLLRVVLVVLAALAVAAAATVVVIEIRAAGSSGERRTRLRARRSIAGRPHTAEVSPDAALLASLDSAPPGDQPVLLLRALVQALTRAHRLRRERDLTCRELIAAARFDTAGQRGDFQNVALLAERALYGGPRAPLPTIPEEVLRSARALHDQLLAAPGPERAVGS